MLNDTDLKLSALKGTQFFQSLSEDELNQLSDLFVIESYPPERTLVKQDEEVTDFYIILAGKAEVWLQKETKKSLLVATLGENDIIGQVDVNAEKPIRRNATIITILPTRVMKIAASALETWIHGHPQIQERLRAYHHRIEIINFIKSSTPFLDIPHKTANDLVDKLTKKEVREGTKIIQQEDLAQECYLLEDGTASVIIKDETGQEKVVQELNSGDLFGELGLFEGHRRNATVRAEVDCRLYTLSREHFLTVLKDHDDVARKVSYLSKHRNRPKRVDGIVVIEQKNSAGKSSYILKNPTTHKYLKIEDEGWYLWQQMDGSKTIHDLVIGFLEQSGKFMPQQIMKLILDLDDMGMVNVTYYRQINEKTSFKYKILQGMINIFESKYTLRNVDQKFTQIYNSIGHLIYNKVVISCLTLLIFLGLAAFFINASTTLALFQSKANNFHFLIYVYLVLPIMIALHEFAHGLTTKAIGCEVGGFGVGWYWFGPIAFCDTTDTWLAPPKDRIKVNAAGMFSDLILAGCSSLLALALSGTDWGIFFWLLSALFYMISFVNMGTLIELDGYYILSDLLDEPNLRRNAFLWISKFPKQIIQPALLRQNYKNICYWLVSAIYVVLLIAIYSYFQNNILIHILPEKLTGYSGYFRMIIPTLLLVSIFLAVKADIKNYNQ